MLELSLNFVVFFFSKIERKRKKKSVWAPKIVCGWLVVVASRVSGGKCLNYSKIFVVFFL